MMPSPTPLCLCLTYRRYSIYHEWMKNKQMKEVTAKWSHPRLTGLRSNWFLHKKENLSLTFQDSSFPIKWELLKQEFLTLNIHLLQRGKKNDSLISEIWREEKCQSHPSLSKQKAFYPFFLTSDPWEAQSKIMSSIGKADQETRFLQRDLPETTGTTSSWISVSPFAKRGK